MDDELEPTNQETALDEVAGDGRHADTYELVAWAAAQRAVNVLGKKAECQFHALAIPCWVLSTTTCGDRMALG